MLVLNWLPPHPPPVDPERQGPRQQELRGPGIQVPLELRALVAQVQQEPLGLGLLGPLALPGQELQAQAAPGRLEQQGLGPLELELRERAVQVQQELLGLEVPGPLELELPGLVEAKVP